MHLHEKSFLKFSFERVGNAHFKVYCIWNQVLPFVGESFKPSCISLGGEKTFNFLRFLTNESLMQPGFFPLVLKAEAGKRDLVRLTGMASRNATPPVTARR